MSVINLPLAYPVVLTHADEFTVQLQALSKDFIRTTTHWIIVTDSEVAPLYAQALSTCLQQIIQAQLGTSAKTIVIETIIVTAGEAFKTRASKQAIEDQMLSLGCGRQTAVLALGGGMITDLAGFVAATYHRGVPVCYFPTTLLAMVDASIGGKTGVNTAEGKNLIGAFNQPAAVCMNVSYLQSLSELDYRFAFAEIYKHALIWDAEHFAWLNQHWAALTARDQTKLLKVIERSCQIKAAVVLADETEQGLRAILNLGHSFAHAIELSSQHQIPHGLAVALGLLTEAALSNQLGYLSSADFQQVMTVFDKLVKPPTRVQDATETVASSRLQAALTRAYTFIQDWTDSDCWAALKRDKKNKAGQVQMVLLQSIGQVVEPEPTVYTVAVSAEQCFSALRYVKQHIKQMGLETVCASL